MRPPRYRFPDQVRDATWAMAERMVDGGTVVQTPEQLDAWIAGAPDAREPLERGGYGREFTSDDLLPLLHVFVTKLGGTAGPEPTAAAAPPSRNRWLVIAAVAAVLLVIVVLATNALR